MKETHEFENKHGSEVFVRVCLSALNQLLVKKGIVTEEELKESLLTEMSNVERFPELRQQDIKSRKDKENEE